MLDLEYSGRMLDDIERAKRRGKDLSKLWRVVEKLRRRERLDAGNHDHKLHGKMKDCRECHIERDWLLVYKVIKEMLVLYLVSTGTHDETLN